jgi:hypothetical protein
MLLYWLVDTNVKNREGRFYGMGMEKLATYRRMWDLIIFKKRHRARQQKAASRAKPPAPGDISSSDDDIPDDDIQLDPTEGTATIIWVEGLPDALEEAGENGRRTMQPFFAYTQAESAEAVDAAFNLRSHRQGQTALESKGGLSYRGAQLVTHRTQKKAMFYLSTEETSIEEGVQPVPDPVITFFTCSARD